MSDKQFELYRTIQIDAGAVSHNLINFRTELETASLDRETLLKGYDTLISTANELAILISKVAQLIFKK
jgi:hypothetical protein